MGRLWAPKIDQNRTQNESKFKTIFNSEKVGLQEPLGAVLGRSWGILEVILGSILALRYWNSYYLVKIHVFDVDKLSRRVFDRTWPLLASKSAKNDPKMAPQNDPKSIKNRCQKMIKILIASKRPKARSRGPSGGVRGALGGNIRGVMICQRCLKISNFAYMSPQLRLGKTNCDQDD